MYLFFVCCRNGRLQENDQILAIDSQVLKSSISHQQAISILQRASGRVEIVVAREQLPVSAKPELDDQPLTAPNLDRTASAASEGSDMVVSYPVDN